MNLRLVLMRHLIMEIANVADLATISGALYKEHPELGELHRPLRRGLEFFKYLRNVYVGHFVPDLCEKTFEWVPQTYAAIGSVEPAKMWIVSWFALETAINTYADPETGHKIFPSETDLQYPPDYTRFLNFLGETVLGSIAYASCLISTARSHVDVPDIEQDMMELAFAAGRTSFGVLKKGKR